MATLNLRQKEHVQRAQTIAKMASIMSGYCAEIVEAHAEEFASGQGNEIISADLQDAYNFGTAELNSFINQFCKNYVDMWTNEPLTQREYGKDVRLVLSHDAKLPH